MLIAQTKGHEKTAEFTSGYMDSLLPDGSARLLSISHRH